MMDAKLIIFDLDGTLVDTSAGIFQTARVTMSALHRDGDVPMERMRKFIGPPIDECFRIVYDLPSEVIPEAVRLYKIRYKSNGQYEATVYPEIPPLLEALKARGYRLAVGTLKSEDTARNMLAHFGIAHYFDVIRGDHPFGGRTKADVLRLVASDLGCSIADALLVGDTMHDKNGAVSVCMRFVAVTYGFGFKEGTLSGDGIDAVIARPAELLQLLP